MQVGSNYKPLNVTKNTSPLNEKTSNHIVFFVFIPLVFVEFTMHVVYTVTYALHGYQIRKQYNTNVGYNNFKREKKCKILQIP